MMMIFTIQTYLGNNNTFFKTLKENLGKMSLIKTNSICLREDTIGIISKQ